MSHNEPYHVDATNSLILPISSVSDSYYNLKAHSKGVENPSGVEDNPPVGHLTVRLYTR
jgi:hypothetical protein